MAKTTMTKEVKNELHKILAKHSLDKEYKKLNQAIVSFSDDIYDLKISVDMESNLKQLAINPVNWFRYASMLNVTILSKVRNYQGYHVEPINLVKNLVEDHMLPIGSFERNSIMLRFSNSRIVPIHNVVEVFNLSDKEIKEYAAIIAKYEKRIDKVTEGVKTGMAIISSFKYFEDLFEHWAASEKLFKDIYQQRKEAVKIDKKQFLPSTDVTDLNKDLGLED